MQNQTPQNPGKNNDIELRQSMGEGSRTFGMDASMTNVPTPYIHRGEPEAAGGATFHIADKACNIQGICTLLSCGVLAIIEERFLADVLTLTSVDTGYFDFTYGNGAYEIIWGLMAAEN